MNMISDLDLSPTRGTPALPHLVSLFTAAVGAALATTEIAVAGAAAPAFVNIEVGGTEEPTCRLLATVRTAVEPCHPHVYSPPKKELQDSSIPFTDTR